MITPDTQRFTRIAERMQARLETWPALQGAPVVVDRQHDIDAEVGEAVAKAQGLCLTIFFEGFLNNNTEADALAPALRYTVRAWGMPVVIDAGGEFVPTEVACIEASKALHGWNPEGDEQDTFSRFEVGRADTEPDRSFLIYSIPVTLSRIIL